jgi:mannitol/fructose-specific phosphotransferase system IIA component (Ntr-type)
VFTTVDDLSRFVAFELGHGPEGVLPHARLDSAYQLGVIVFRNATGGKARIGRLSVDVLQMLILAKIDADKAARGPG